MFLFEKDMFLLGGLLLGGLLMSGPLHLVCSLFGPRIVRVVVSFTSFCFATMAIEAVEVGVLHKVMQCTCGKKFHVVKTDDEMGDLHKLRSRIFSHVVDEKDNHILTTRCDIVALTPSMVSLTSKCTCYGRKDCSPEDDRRILCVDCGRWFRRRIAGGQSAVLRSLLENWFLGPKGISTSGIVFPFGDGPCIRYIDLTNLLADEEYLSQAWNINGASGLMCCLKCKNVAGARSGMASGDIVDISCSDPNRFSRRTDEEAWAVHEFLEEHAWMQTTKGFITEFKKMQTHTGFKYHPKDLLAARSLKPFIRPITITTYDSMHCLLQNGHASFAIGHFLAAAEETCEFEWVELREVAGCEWLLPKSRRMRNVVEFFSLQRETSTRSSGSYKAKAGEILAIYPIVRFFAETVLALRDGMETQMESLLSICKVLDDFQNAKARIKPDGSLVDSISQHLEAFLAANPGVFVKPKTHLLYHCAEQIQENETEEDEAFLVDCFVCERKHQMMKRACFHIKRTTKFEKSAMARAFQDTVRVLSSPTVFSNGLRGSTQRVPHSGSVVGKQMQFDGIEYHSGDCCFAGSALLLVEGCMVSGETCYLVVRAGALLDKVTPHSSRWSFDDNLCKLQLGICVTKHASLWAWQDDGSVLVLH